MTSAAVAFRRPPTFDPLRIDLLDDAELDELPFGVVCLDAEGTILRYNLAEARLARLDRNSVVGRDFFEEIAPCTATDAFQGEFERFVEGAHAALVHRFSYLFDFKFGAQEVDVELVASPDRQRFYLLINRRSFLPVRDEPFRPAPRQSDLLPPEQDLGVRRDERAQRVVVAPQLLFEALLKACDRVAPETWEIFTAEWGTQWGRRLAVDLETRCLEDTQSSLRDRPMQEVAERLAACFADEGWGALRFDLGRAADGLVHVAVDASLLAAASRRGRRSCHLLAGALGAVLSHLAGRRLVACETRCAAQGHPRCDIVITGPRRAAALAAIAERDLDVDAIAAELRGPDA